MKIFISWSGASSREVAIALKTWLPKVIQGVRPFVSAKDIDKGSNWVVELTKELTDSDFGIICLAPDNLRSPWLNYEAGAITKSVNSRVAPVLFNVGKEEVDHPLAQLQLTSIDIEEFKNLMRSINNVANKGLSDEQVEQSVEVWWSQLEEEIKKISIPDKLSEKEKRSAKEPEKPEPGIFEMLGDILSYLRRLDKRLTEIELGRQGDTGLGIPARRIPARKSKISSLTRDSSSSIENIYSLFNEMEATEKRLQKLDFILDPVFDFELGLLKEVQVIGDTSKLTEKELDYLVNEIQVLTDKLGEKVSLVSQRSN